MRQGKDIDVFGVVAEAMTKGFRFTDALCAEHEAEFGMPMTLMSRIQTIRSVAIALLSTDDSGVLQLSDAFVELGKIEVKDLATGSHYLLRARSRRPAFVPIGGQLFETEEWVHHVLLYGLEGSHLVLSTGPISVLRNRNEAPRLILRGELVEQGRYRIHPDGAEDEPSTSDSFDQGEADTFNDLGNIDLDLDADEY